MPDLPPEVRERLIRLCGLLTSDFDGERATAAEMASRLLLQHKMTWRDVLTAPPLPPPPDRRRADDASPFWRKLVDEALDAEALTDWERDFLCNLLRRGGPSGKQGSILFQIVVKARKQRRAA